MGAVCKMTLHVVLTEKANAYPKQIGRVGQALYEMGFKSLPASIIFSEKEGEPDEIEVRMYRD